MPDHPGHKQLIRSMDHFEIDYHVINAPWRGYGTKIIETSKYVKSIQNQYANFIFVDGHDTFFLENMEGVPHNANIPMGSIWFNGEKACWPDRELAHYFDNVPEKNRWRYLNSGCYISGIPNFLQLVEENPINHNEDDQRWATRLYLKQDGGVMIDHVCTLFQSIAFMADDEYNFNYETGRLENLITGSKPRIIHANGGGHNLDKVYALIPEK